jgi:glycosyl transferase family 25
MLNKFGISEVFVIHARNGSEQREKRVKELFKQHNIPFQFISEEDSVLPIEELSANYFPPNIRETLSKGVVLCTLSHFVCYEKIVKQKNALTLIFEDDPCVLKDFNKRLERVTHEAKNLKEGFIISLERTTLQFPSWWKIRKGQYLYEAQKSRCAGAYLVDLKAANLMLENLKHEKCRKAIDIWHNIILQKGIINMYWSHPPLTEQGSHNGRLHSQIQQSRNRYQWLVQKIYKMYILRWFR